MFQIPWGHNIVIIQKCKDINEAIFYVENTLKNGISRNVLIHQIESDLYHKQKKAVNNFDNTLPTISEDYKEKELENALIENIKDFLIELGSGFAFVGKQYKLEIENQEFIVLSSKTSFICSN